MNLKHEKKVEVFLQYLEKELIKQHLSVPKLASAMGIPRATIYAWLKRESVMGLGMYFRLLEVLGLEEKYHREFNFIKGRYEKENCTNI